EGEGALAAGSEAALTSSSMETSMRQGEPGLLGTLLESAYDRFGGWLFGRSVRDLLADHFEQPPGGLPVVEEPIGVAEHPNLQLAIDDFTARAGWSSRLIGLTSSGLFGFEPITLTGIVNGSGLGGVRAGPVSYRRVALDDDRAVSCIQQGLFLVSGGGGKVALLVSRPLSIAGEGDLRIEVMAPDRGAAEQVLADIRAAAARRNVYRGKIISLEMTRSREVNVRFH
ncbi:MAG: hypothetical protein HYV63_21945, partial [Candidatus Schekmanbacteria bacterium]|nr:hypothetical protein [Candidatus Schekmanbacteria bacterium]